MHRLLFALLTSLLLAVPALAQDYEATTAQDTKIEIDVLRLKLRPLQLAEVEAEAKAWQDKLAEVARQITQVEVASKTGGDTANLPNLSELREEQSRVNDRFEYVLRAFAARGGDRTPYDQYRDQATALSFDATDVGGATTMITDWVTSSEGGIKWAVNIVKFLVTLLAFKIIAAIAAGIVRRAVSRMKKTSDLLRDFFVNVTRRLVFFIGLIIALEMLGLDVTPFVAALGAAGFIIGFALQGTLSNFAAGLMILIYRPYDIGQVVNVAGTTGSVDAMTLVSTTLKLPDNQRVVIPNNSIWGNVITNVTGQTTRRCDLKFGCGYGDDLKKVQSVLEDIVSNHEKVHKDPAPVIKLHELADSSVNFIIRAWCNTGDYWDVYWDVTRAVKERFDAEGLNIPFPQRDVHLHQVKD